jgi:hypothetical protein
MADAPLSKRLIMILSMPDNNVDQSVSSSKDHEVTDGETAPCTHIEEQSLRELFDSRKADALQKVRDLLELIDDIELNGWLDDEPATDELRPGRALSVARVLCWHLEDIEALNLIVANAV